MKSIRSFLAAVLISSSLLLPVFAGEEEGTTVQDFLDSAGIDIELPEELQNFDLGDLDLNFDPKTIDLDGIDLSGLEDITNPEALQEFLDGLSEKAEKAKESMEKARETVEKAKGFAEKLHQFGQKVKPVFRTVGNTIQSLWNFVSGLAD